MAAERQLIADHDLPDIEALVVGHHGSKSSTSKDALRRLVLADVEIYRTDKQGTVHLSVN